MRQGYFSAFALSILISLGSHASAQIGQWTQQPIQGSVPGLWAVSMKDTGLGIASGMTDIAGGTSGVIRKTTGDPTWYPVPLANFSPAIPANFNAWYGASAFSNSSIMYVCGNNSKVYKSTDDGLNWTQQTTGIGISKTLFGMHFSNASTGLVVGDDGVAFYTTNGGTSWTSQTTGTTQTLLAVHSSGGTWYVSGANNTVLKFTPPSSWTTLSIAPHTSIGQAIADVKFVTSTEGYVSGGNALLSGKVLYTNSSGNSWVTANIPQQGAPYLYSAMWWFGQSTGWVANVFDAIYYTSNGGSNWTKYSAIPTIGAGGGVTELSFPSFDIGYGSGGAIGGSGPTTGWIIKFEPASHDPEIVVADTIDLDTLGCGLIRNQQFIIGNTGNADLIIPANGITFTNPDMTVMPAPPLAVPPNDQRMLTLRWAPPPGFTGPLPPGTTMTIQSNDPNTPSKVVVLKGVRLNPNVSLADTHLVFNSGCQGQATSINVLGTPNGPNPRYLDWQFVSGDDAVTITSPTPGTVIGAAMNFTFEFSPGSGPMSGTYHFLSGSSSCPDTTVVTFSGGVQQAALDIPTTLDFGAVCTEHTEDLIVDLHNNGSGPAQIVKREYVSGKNLFPDAMGTPWGPVPAGGSLPYTFRFRPGQFDTGAVSATYRFILGPCPDTITVTFTGFGVKNPVQVIPTNVLVLGPTPVGGQNDGQVFVNNVSSVPVEIASVRMQPTHPSIQWIGLPTFPQTIAPGGQLVLDIRYQPTKIETLSSDICVRYTSPCTDSICISLAASSNNPPKIVVQNSINIGVQRCDTPIRDTLPVSNAGPGVLTLTEMLVGGPNAAHFTVIEPASFPVNILSGDTAFVIIEYNSPVEGPSVATVIINHNDPSVSKHSTVTLSGTREVYKFIVVGDTTSSIAACFGDEATRTFTIRNNGVHEIQIISIGINQSIPRFETGIIAVPAVLQPGDSLPVTVRLPIDFVGPHQGTLRIVSEPCMYTREITLNGEGLKSFLSFNPPELDFGNISAGGSSDISVEVRNTGLGDVTIDSLVYVPGSSEFSLSGGPGFPLSMVPMAGAQFTATYAPKSGAGLSGTLCAYISDPCADTICINVRGSSNTDVLAADRTAVDIHLNPCIVGKACESVTVKNFAAIPHTVSDVSLLQLGSVFEISQPSNVPFTVNPGGEFTLQVCAAGTFTGTDTATVTISTSTGAAPVQVRFIAHRDSVHLDIPKSYNMGVMARCQSELFKGFPITNTGTAQDTLDIVSGVKAPFLVISGFPLAVPAGRVTDLELRFSTSGYAIYADTLVLQSRRCGTTYRVVLNGAYLERNFEIVPNPLVFGGVQTGSSLTQSFTVRNMNLRNARISHVYFSDPVFSTTVAPPLALDSGKVISIPVMFSPTEQRGYAETVCVVFDQPCLDTLCISLTGTGIEGQLKLSPVAIDLDSLVQCIVRVDTIRLENTGSAAIVLDSAHIEGPSSAACSILNPVVTAEPMQPGSIRDFYVQFSANAIPAGPIQAALVVFTDDQNQPRLETQLTGTRISQTVQKNLSLDFGSIQAGTPSTQTLTLTNNGQSAFTYTGANLPPGVSIVPAPPFTLAPGGSASIQVTITALQAGPLTTAFSLYVTNPCEDSTIVHCTGTVTSGVSLIGAIASPVASCDTVVMYVLMKNPLGTSITVDDLHIEGVDAASFILDSPSTPRTVGPGDSLTILVRFIPTPGRDLQYNAECVATITSGSASTTLRAVLIANVFIPELSLVDATDFGGVAVDDPAELLNVRYVNNSPFPIRVTAASFTDPEFAFESSLPALPATLAPGDTLAIVASFLPSDQGDFTGILEFTVTEPCASSFQTPYAASGLPPNIVLVDLAVESHSGELEEIIKVPILLRSDLGMLGIDGYHVGLQFNRSMLYPTSYGKPGTLSEDMDIKLDWDFDTGTLWIDAFGAPLRAGTGTLVEVNFLVLIGTAESTPIEILDSIMLNSTAKINLSRQNGMFTLTDYCFGDGNRLISTEGLNFLSTPSPNPAQSLATVRFGIAEDGFVELTVYNSMGEVVQTLVAENRKRGTYTTSFDASGLPSGMYIVVMQTGTFTASRRITIAR